MPQKRLKNPSPGVSRRFALDQAIVMVHHLQVPGPELAINIQNLAYSYGRAEAVHDLSLRVLPAGVTDSSAATARAKRPQ